MSSPVSAVTRGGCSRAWIACAVLLTTVSSGLSGSRGQFPGTVVDIGEVAAHPGWTVTLAGGWECVLDSLLTPRQFRAYRSEHDVDTFDVPHFWRNVVDEGTVHAATLYSAVNVAMRTPPGPMLAELVNSGLYSPVGDNYWVLRAGEFRSIDG